MTLLDGEIVTLNWMFPKSSLDMVVEGCPEITMDVASKISIAPETPIILILHGVFQTAADLHDFCKFLTEKCGFVCCIFNRRGNDLALSRPR